MPSLDLSSDFATDLSGNAPGAVGAVDPGEVDGDSISLEGGVNCNEADGRGGATNVEGSGFPCSI